MNELYIRDAKITDKQGLALLCNQLGYPIMVEDIPSRLDQINQLDHHIVFVAEMGSQLVGWVHVYLCPLLISERQAQLGGMIVKDEYRNKGIGTSLLKQSEEWARSNGCQKLTIFSNTFRRETHQFYAQMGYQVLKTEHVFIKEL